MARGTSEVDILAGYAVKRIKPSFNIGCPEELLFWKIVERAILDLATQEHRLNAAKWIRDYNWPSEVAGVDAAWIIDRLKFYGLWPQGIQQNAQN